MSSFLLCYFLLGEDKLLGQVLLFFLGFRQSTALYVQLLGFWGGCHPPTRNYIHEQLEFISSGEKQITWL